MTNTRQGLASVGAALALLAAGCQQSEFDLAPVSGIVSLDGEPLPGARVTFEPMKTGAADPLAVGPGSFGETDEAGRFELETLGEDRGAVVGLHRVRISTYLAEFDPSRGQQKMIRGEQVPAHYDGTGALEFQVPAGGTAAADFALQSRLTSEGK